MIFFIFIYFVAFNFICWYFTLFIALFLRMFILAFSPFTGLMSHERNREMYQEIVAEIQALIVKGNALLFCSPLLAFYLSFRSFLVLFSSAINAKIFFVFFFVLK